MLTQNRTSKTLIFIVILLAGAWYTGLLLLQRAQAGDFASNLTKLETYIEQQGFTWQQVKNATPRQWYTHAIAAGFTVEEIRRFSRSRNVLRSAIVKRMKRAIVVAQAMALWTHIRKAGPDVETVPLLREILENWEVYGVDPNAFN